MKKNKVLFCVFMSWLLTLTSCTLFGSNGGKASSSSIPEESDLPESEKVTIIATPMANPEYCSIKAGPSFSRSVTHFTVPKTVGGMTVKSIEAKGFANALGLQSVTFESGSKVETIDSAAFAGCASLSFVFIPDTVEKILSSAFRNNSADVLFFLEAPSRPSGWAFDDFYSSGTWNYKQGVCHWGKTDYEIGADGYVYATRLDGAIAIARYDGDETALVIPSEHGGAKLTEISAYAFAKHTKIKSVVFPNTITLYQSSCFEGCILLHDLEIPSPAGGKTGTIENGAFLGCTALKYVVIHSSIDRIGEGAFRSNASGILFFCSASSRPSGWAFDDFYSSGTWNYKQGTTYWSNEGYYANEETGWVYGLRNTSAGRFYQLDYCPENGASIVVPDTVPSGSVKGIGSYALAKKTKLTSLSLPTQTLEIGDHAFYQDNLLAALSLPSSLQILGANAFDGCSSLGYIVIPSSVSLIGSDCFDHHSTNFKIFVEGKTSAPEGWYHNSYDSSSSWDGGALVYWKGQWHYDAAGTPVFG